MSTLQTRAIRFLRSATSAALLLLALVWPAHGAGLFGDGTDARSIAIGGAEAAQSGSALAAMNTNPAALSEPEKAQFEIDFGGGFLSGKFERDSGETARVRSYAGFIPAAALAIPAPHNIPIAFGLAVLPDIMSEADWRYTDASGGLGGTTTYGERTHRSEIIALRTSFGIAVKAARWFSFGASAGAIYNENQLEAPYIFQSQPVLRGFKTLLDLDTDGFGAVFNVGAQFRPAATVTFGISYRPETVIHSDGRATGNARAQLLALGGGFAQVDPQFAYDASVRTNLPQIVSTAIEWQAAPKFRLVGGVDWINWSDAFDELIIDLNHGSNAAINGVVGSDAMTDIAPLNWRDQFVFRSGIEYAATDNFTLRAGYSYARSAVPSDTLTPLTAAIFEHKLSAGIGYHAGRFHSDLAWLWALPRTQHVGVSALLDGEYSNSSVRVTQHSLEWSSGIDF